MRRIAIIQDYLPSYRVRFYQNLHELLLNDNIRLELFYGINFSDPEAVRTLNWSTPVHTTWVGPFIWQEVNSLCLQCDLVVVPQQLRQLSSILLHLSRFTGNRRHAFWGHGASQHAANLSPPVKAWKKYLSKRVDWWFAYNNMAADFVKDMGYPEERITRVMNAIDTTGIHQQLKELAGDDLESVRRDLGIDSHNVAVYTGSLRQIKRPEFLVAACEKIRERVPDFEMILIGDGPDAPMMEEAAARWPWFHYLGRKNDMEKVPYCALAKLLLMPGGVGLVVLDSFALGIPMVTTENRFHGPEIDYLKDGVNGLMVKPGDDPDHYAAEVAALLRDDPRREAMAAAALAERGRYSSEDMADRFATGIMQALEAPRYRVFF